MDTEKRPRAHQKKESGQSVNVNKTDKVETGHGPVGSGGCPPQTPPSSGGSNKTSYQRPAGSGSSSSYRRSSSLLGNNKLLLIILVVAILFLLTRSCGNSSQSYTQPQAGTQQTVPVTAAPTAAPTAEPTQAPAVTAAPTQAPVSAGTEARAKRYVPLGNGKDTVTVMVFMCGTDLESNYGMATSDLQEMASANIGSNVNVIVETGGCKMWKNRIVSNSTNQIYKVESGGVRLLKDNMGSKPMVQPATLTEFIQFCRTNYPADRNILIFWDHGGGSISGYGYDELYKSAGAMDLAEISTALKDADCTFDWIGFDACLMATLETALVCEPYADYLIASEETEPGTGWYYTNWLTALSKNTSVDTESLAKLLIDDFVRTSTGASASAKVGLSLTDLADLSGAVPAAFRDFSLSTTQLISSNSYATVSNARASARQFAQSSRINQIDLVDFANRIGTAEAQALSQAVRSCVKYNNTNISHAYGLSIFFPYETMKTVKTAVSTYQQVGMDEAYTKCISSFASLASSGQLSAAAGTYGGSSYGSGYTSGGLDLGSLLGAYLGGSSGSSSGSSYGSYGGSYGASPLGSLLGGYTGTGGNTSAGASIDPAMLMQLLGAFAGGRSLPDWADADTMDRAASYVAENYIDPGDIFVTVRNDGARILSLTGEQWDLIQDVALNVFVDDGEGFIDMGLDNVDFEFDGNDLVMNYSGKWMTVNGAPVAYYMLSVTDDDEGYLVRGRIPALLTSSSALLSSVNSSSGLKALDGTVGNGSDAPQSVTHLVDLEVIFDDENPYGVITGARPMYEDDTSTLAKGDLTIQPGDQIQFLCDYYGYDGSYQSTYKLGSPIVVERGGLEVAYSHLDEDVSVTYRLTDIYSNHYWTPAWVA
ncbi:MAG: peptidase C11 [Oscillospiraceae bacterium]|nr:peptidase C11 [Oscillospiraceae bacterium]